MTNIIKGTDLKFNINVEPLKDTHVIEYDFEVVAYVSGSKKKYTAYKDDCIMVDADNFIVEIPTSSMPAGKLIIDLYAYVPDLEVPDNTRVEVVRLDPDITIEV